MSKIWACVWREIAEKMVYIKWIIVIEFGLCLGKSSCWEIICCQLEDGRVYDHLLLLFPWWYSYKYSNRVVVLDSNMRLTWSHGLSNLHIENVWILMKQGAKLTQVPRNKILFKNYIIIFFFCKLGWLCTVFFKISLYISSCCEKYE